MTIVRDIATSAGGPGSVTVIGTATGSEARIGWSRLHSRARHTAAALVDMGIGRGSRVGLLGEPSIALIQALQAAWLAGAAISVLPVSTPRTISGRLGPMVRDARLDLLVADPRQATAATAALTVPVVTTADLERLATAVPPLAMRHPDPADLAVLQYTSGSTSAPRGVPVSHGNLAANLAALKAVFRHDLHHPHPIVSWLPLSHDMGLIGFLALAMSCGCPLVLQPPAAFAARPASWLRALSRHGAVVTGAPDSAYRLVTPLLEAGMDIDLRTVRFMLCGGEPISPATVNRFVAAASRYGLDPAAIVPAYGLAESTLVVTCTRPGAGLTTDTVDLDELERHARAVPCRTGRVRTLTRPGTPVPGGEVRVVGDSGAPAGPRQVGGVQVRGASVAGHYWGEPAPPAGSWLDTGDLGYLAEGELVLCGRRKDVLFAAGRNLYPQDVELAACHVADVRAGGAVAFGLSGEEGDRLVVAVESRAPDRPSVCRAVSVAVAAETGVRPAAVIALRPGRLPRTTSGKLRRAEARRRYECGELTDRP